jgi:ribonuclease T2
MRKRKRQLAAVSSSLAMLVIIALFVYQSLQNSASTASLPPTSTQPPASATLPVVDARPSRTPAPATDTARPSSTPSARPWSTATAQAGKKADFDFYVLNLSWSPDYCATSGSNDAQQCSLGKKLGFVLHGLWPQYNQGWPEYCAYLKLPSEVKAKYPNLYPSASLYDHEWDKHGTCSGLTPEGYLSLAQKLKQSVVVPAPYKSPEQPVRVTTAQFKKDIPVHVHSNVTERRIQPRQWLCPVLQSASVIGAPERVCDGIGRQRFGVGNSLLGYLQPFGLMKGPYDGHARGIHLLPDPFYVISHLNTDAGAKLPPSLLVMVQQLSAPIHQRLVRIIGQTDGRLPFRG